MSEPNKTAIDKTATGSSRFKMLTDSDLAKTPPITWAIKKLLPDKGVAAIYGPSGSGKSFLVLDMLQKIAAGEAWFGRKVSSRSVLYIALEGEAGLPNRLSAYRKKFGNTSDNIRYLVQPFSLLSERDITELAKLIKNSGGCNIVVLDTLNRATPGGDENDSVSMGLIIANTQKLQKLIDGLILLIHHTGKDITKGLRGHSSLHAALDAEIEIRRNNNYREWIIAKVKDGEEGKSTPFALEVIELGKDNDDDPISSCVIQPLESNDIVNYKVLTPKAGNQKIIYDALCEILRGVGDSRPDDAPSELPQGRPCIKLEHAIERTRARLVCESKRQTERTKAAITGLISNGLIVHRQGYLWVT